MNIKLYQIVYDQSQITGDEGFTVYSNAHNNCDKLHNHREYPVFLESYKTGLCNNNDYTGFLSWKFNKKTGWCGRDLDAAIRVTSDKQVYFINCGPRVKNVWSHGERRHGGIISLTQEVLDNLNIDINISSVHQDASKTCFCNYWVGTPEFWSKYITFTEPIYSYLANNTDPEFRKRLYLKADKGITCGYIPFVMERLFTTLLCVDDSITYKSIPKAK